MDLLGFLQEIKDAVDGLNAAFLGKGCASDGDGVGSTNTSSVDKDTLGGAAKHLASLSNGIARMQDSLTRLSALTPGKTDVPSIDGREAVKKTMDELIEFYKSQDPGSPVHVILRRTKRLVDNSYLDIIRTLQGRGGKAVLPLIDSPS